MDCARLLGFLPRGPRDADAGAQMNQRMPPFRRRRPNLPRSHAGRHLVLQSNAELGGMIDGLLGRVAGVLWALLALAFVVASLGIDNTLTTRLSKLDPLHVTGLKGQVVRCQ